MFEVIADDKRIGFGYELNRNFKLHKIFPLVKGLY